MKEVNLIMDKNNKYYQELDRIVQSTLINIYSIANREGKIVLLNFDPKVNTDKCIIEIARIAVHVWRFEVEVDLPLFKYLMFKFKNRDIIVKRYKKFAENKIDVQELKSFVAKSYVKTTMIFDEIYNEYYKPLKKGFGE